jgi:ferric-dicitrate binding protein FerR (iron transport regulator)
MKPNASGLLISVLLVLLSNGFAPGLEQPSMESIRALVDSEVLFGNGIRIELKKGTKLSYPSIVHEHDIPFILLGEARFKVLSGYRLTVEYDKIVVKATAASFSLEKGRGTIEVTVFSNEASITVDQRQFSIHAFQRATYHVATKQLTLVDTRVKRI